MTSTPVQSTQLPQITSTHLLLFTHLAITTIHCTYYSRLRWRAEVFETVSPWCFALSPLGRHGFELAHQDVRYRVHDLQRQAFEGYALWQLWLRQPLRRTNTTYETRRRLQTTTSNIIDVNVSTYNHFWHYDDSTITITITNHNHRHHSTIPNQRQLTPFPSSHYEYNSTSNLRNTA